MTNQVIRPGEVTAGEGYRLLEPGESVYKGDETLVDGVWCDVHRDWTGRASIFPHAVRRRVSEKAAEDIFPPKPAPGGWDATAIKAAAFKGVVIPPKEPVIDPGPGWRLLEGDEIVRDGDEARSFATDWWEVSLLGRTLTQYTNFYPGVVAVRRRVEPEQPQAIEEQEQFDRTNHIEPGMQIVPQSANGIQHGGDHYRSKPIQPWDYIASNGLGFFEGNIVKYVTRWPERGGLVDLRKAQHYIEKLIEIETAKETGQ